MRALALACAAAFYLPPAAAAQVAGAEAAFHTLSIGGARLRELVLPVGGGVWLGPLSLDANTAYAHAVLERGAERSEIQGFTDIVARAGLRLVRDRARILLSANLPTGESSLTPATVPVAAALSTDLLALPVRSFGSGAGVTAGLALVQPLAGWTLGFVGSYRLGSAYEPFLPAAGAGGTEFRPGNELRLHAVFERHPGRWGVRLAGSWSRFGEDEASGVAFFRAGDRFLAEAQLDFPLGRGAGSLYAWSLQRASGQLRGSSAATELAAARRSLEGAIARLAVPLGQALVANPTFEVLAQHTAGPVAAAVDDGWLFRAGSSVVIWLGRLAVEPAVLAQWGELDGAAIRGWVFRTGVAWAR